MLLVFGRIRRREGVASATSSNATSAEVFDSQTQTWAPIASMSTERKFAMVAAVQGKLYAAGGDDVGDGAEGNVQRSVEAYDPQQNRFIR